MSHDVVRHVFDLVPLLIPAVNWQLVEQIWKDEV